MCHSVQLLRHGVYGGRPDGTGHRSGRTCLLLHSQNKEDGKEIFYCHLLSLVFFTDYLLTNFALLPFLFNVLKHTINSIKVALLILQMVCLYWFCFEFAYTSCLLSDTCYNYCI